MSVLVTALKVSPRICGSVPSPKPKFSLFGLAFACATNSATVFAGTSGAITMHLRAAREHRHGRKALGEIVAGVRIDHRRDDEARGGDQDRIAVGIGRCRGLGAERGAGAGTIVDDDGLAEPGARVLRRQTRQHVDRRSRRVGHHHLDRLGRIALRGGGCGAQSDNHQTCRDRPPPCHTLFLKRARKHRAIAMDVSAPISAFPASQPCCANPPLCPLKGAPEKVYDAVQRPCLSIPVRPLNSGVSTRGSRSHGASQDCIDRSRPDRRHARSPHRSQGARRCRAVRHRRGHPAGQVARPRAVLAGRRLRREAGRHQFV